MSLLKRITEKAKNIKGATFTDESLRFELNKEDQNAIVDFYSLSLDEIESLLGIKQYEKGSNYNYSAIFDDWYEVVYFIESIKNNNKYNVSSSEWIIGYEIYNEHYIKVYTNSHYSNS